MSNQIIIFDLDGTLADCTHRLSYVESGYVDSWHETEHLCGEDPPNTEIITIAQALFERYIIWIFSGRRDKVRKQTESWLLHHKVPYNTLRMRKNDAAFHEYDIPDDELKESWVDLYDLTPERVPLVFDDRDRVVAMWRRRGFRCLQVAPGDF